jgi:hypothetical protein
MDKTLTLEYTFKPISFEKINNEFSIMRCYVMALGKNRNYSYFSKESVDNAIPTLYNIPVVAHLKKRDDGGWYVGSHDKQIVIDDDGITVNDLCVPFGVVPESANPEWVEVTESDGSKVEYLTCSVILWTGRYPDLLDAKSKTDSEVYYGQSMEINISAWKDFADDKKYTDIVEFEFSSLCLLGRDLENPEYHTEPCFPSARVEPIEFSLNSKFNEEFSLMISELKKLSFHIEDKQFSNEKEVKQNLNEKLELITKYGLTVEQLDFSIEEISLEDLETKLNEFSDAKSQEKDNDSNQELSFSATYRQKREALSNVLDSDITKDADGNIIDEVYFWIEDFSDEYVFVQRNHWSANGDYESNYGRYSYTFDEENLIATLTSDFEEMFLMWLTKEEKDELETERSDYAQLKSDFETYKEQYKTPESEVEELRTFKATKIEAERNDAETELFNMFDEKLKDNEEYKTLKEKASEYDLNTLSKECFAILGKIMADFSFNSNKTNTTVKFNINNKAKGDTDDDQDEYSDFFERYSE